MMRLPYRHRDEDYRFSGNRPPEEEKTGYAPQPIERHRSRQRSRTGSYGSHEPYQEVRPHSAYYTPLQEEKSSIPDNPFQPGQPSETREKPAGQRSFVTEDGSQFDAPAPLQLPEWYRVAQQNAMPADDRRRNSPMVKPAQRLDEEMDQLRLDPLGRPLRRKAEENSRTEISREEFYERAGYPRELVMEQQRLSEEEARMRSRRRHGAMQAAPAKPSSPREESYGQRRRPLTEEENQRRSAAVERYTRSMEQTAAPRPYRREDNSGYPYPALSRQPARYEERRENDTIYEEFIEEDVPFWKKGKVWLAVGVFAFALLNSVLWAMDVHYAAETEKILQERQQAEIAIRDNHPYQFKEWVDREAAKNNLHPAFVAAIILNESSFRPGAESNVGARGLMQVMEETAADIADDLGYTNYHFDMLYDAETNIIFGCYYLGQLSKRFRGDPVCVSAAYHAGAQQVQNWLNTSKYSADGQTLILANMKDGPTTQYAARISRDFAIYQRLYYSDQEETR